MYVLQLDHAAQVKAEKIKLALEKIKEANVKKLFLKAFSRDGSSKSLLVDEKMTVAHVTRLLADKNHVTMDPKWTIVEHLPDLYMGAFTRSRFPYALYKKLSIANGFRKQILLNNFSINNLFFV